MFLVLLTYFVYFALAIAATPEFSDIRTIVGAFKTPTDGLINDEMNEIFRFAFTPAIVQ
jgi:hypothetical protein